MIKKIVNILVKLRYLIHYKLNPIKAARKIGVIVGENCRFVGKVGFSTEPYLISIGNHVSITNSSFITHDGGIWVFREEYPKLDVIKKIEIGNNVFIGDKCIILPGVIIEDNIIIGAGSIVSKKLESGWVYAGVPAKKIKRIEEYKDQVLLDGTPLKGFSYYKKKAFLINHFKTKKINK